MKRLYMSLLVLALVLIPLTGFAVLIQTDWKISGDGLLTFDSSTGLEWLDIPISVNRSFIDISSEFGIDGDFAGFRYASVQEVFQLLTSAGIPDLSGAWSASNYQPVLDLQQLIGITIGSFHETWALTGDIFSPMYHYSVFLQAQTNPLSSVFEQARVVKNVSSIPDDDSISFAGHWLIRDVAVVPEPSTVSLVGSGLLGLVVLRRRLRK